MCMAEFFTDVLRFRFLQYALVAGVLASVACGIVGSYVTVRHIVAVAGAIAHATLGGMGLALYLNREHGWTFLTPMYGAAASALVAALIIALLTVHGKQKEDTVLGAVWSVGMALGVIFISRTRGYAHDLMGYLFGNILMVRPEDLVLIAVLDAFVLAIGLGLFYKIQAVCFDEEFARVRGINTSLLYTLLLCLTAITVVLLVQVVGIVMVIALLALPAAAAGRFASRLGPMMVLAVVLSAVCTVAGLAISYGPDLPSGATVILTAGLVYIAALVARALRDRARRATLATRSKDDPASCPPIPLPTSSKNQSAE
jgi:zinc transport system permease protein